MGMWHKIILSIFQADGSAGTGLRGKARDFISSW